MRRKKIAKKIKIIIIDDEIASAKGLARWIKKEKIEVEIFHRGIDALSYLQEKKEKITVVLLDYILDPEMSGEEVLKSIRKYYPQLPVVVFSGKAQNNIQTLIQGAYAHLRRPLNPPELIRIIKEIASFETTFMNMARDAMQLLKSDICIVWKRDKKNNQFQIIGWTPNFYQDYLNTILDTSENAWLKARKGQPFFISSLKNAENFQHLEAVIDRGWSSLICTPLIHEGRLIGMVDSYTFKEKKIKEKKWLKTRKLLEIFAGQAVETFHATELTKHLRVLQEINQGLASTLEEENILELVLVKAVQIVGADFGWLYMKNGELEKLELKKCENIQRELLDESREMGEGVTGWVADRGIEKYIRDVRQTKNAPDEPIFKSLKGVQVLSQVAVPLKREENTLGVLTVKSRFKNFFTEDEIDLLLSLADIAAVAVERSKLTKHLQELSALAQTATEFDQLAEYVVMAVKDITGAHVSLWMLSSQEEEGDEWMRMIAHRANFTKEYAKNSRIPNNPKESINAYALQKEDFIIKSDIQKDNSDPKFYKIEDAIKYNWRSFMAIPIIGRKGEKIGVLSLYSKDIDKFKFKDGDIMKTFANHAAIAFQELRRIIAMSQLAQVGPVLSVQTLETKTLLYKVAYLALNLTGANCASIYPYDPIRKNFYQRDAIVLVGTRNERIQITDKPRKTGLAALVRQYEAIIVDNIENDHVRIGLKKAKVSKSKKILKRIREAKFIKRENIKAFIAVSLNAFGKEDDKNINSQEVGVFYLNFRAGHYFSEEELQILEIYVNQVSNIIYQHQLFQRTERQKRELETLHDLSLDITSQPDLDKRLKKIINASITLLNARGGKLYLVEEGQKKLKLEAVEGIDEGVQKGDTIDFGQGLAGQVIEASKPAFVDDYSTWKGAIEEYRSLFSSVIAVPLLQNNKPIGVLSVFDDKEKRFFTQDDIDILQRLGQQAALSIHNAKIYKENQALNNLVNQDTLEKAANEVLREISTVIAYDKATFQIIEYPKKNRKLLAYSFDASLINLDLLKPIQQDPLMQKVFEIDEPYIISSTKNALKELWNPNLPQTKDVGSWIGIPLIFENKQLGLITLDHHESRYYTNHDKHRLKHFIKKAIVVIQLIIKKEYLKKIEKRNASEEKIESGQFDYTDLAAINDLINHYMLVEKNERVLKYKEIKEKLLFEYNCQHPFSIKKIALNKVSIFAEINWELQPHINVLLGKNGYGKSHLLRLIASILQKSKKVINASYQPISSVKMILSQNKKDKKLNYENEKFEESNIGKFPILVIPAVRSISQSDSISIVPQRVEGELKEIGATHFIQQYSYQPLLQHRLFVFGNNILKDKEKGEKIIDLLHQSALANLIIKVVKELAGYQFTFFDIKERKGFAEIEIQVKTEGNDQIIPIQKASQGTLSVLYIFMIIYDYLKSLYPDIPEDDILNQKALIIIDEIDAHLHPDWQQKIVGLIRRTFPNIQFILTAHNPLIISGCLENEVSILRQTPEKGYHLEQYPNDFIAWSVSELMGTVYEIKETDESYFYYNNLDIEGLYEKIDNLQKEESLDEQQKIELKKLHEDLKYAIRTSNLKPPKNEKLDLEIQVKALKYKNNKLTKELDKLANTQTKED